MHKTPIKILMTDDHPMIIEGYQNTLLSSKKEHQELDIAIASNCDESIKAIKKSMAIKSPFDIFFFDISLPPSKDGVYQSGVDLAAYVKQYVPAAKVVLLTMFNESYRIHTIIKNIKPEGFLIKSDITSKELSSGFQAVINNPPFYSGTVNKILNKMTSSRLDVDDVSHEILYLLSQGVKNKDMSKRINLSLSMIEKRKKYLKEVFRISDGKDDTLVIKAKDAGFI
ncbi:response regulator transcription factor [Bizionia gelidisalsuginis]|uniref:Response regulator transcription factor n=2 Tax=Bizionia TaxID=283785 RepID=A0A8H2QKF0_9FLAO|nr:MULTISPECIES: response regulator transcription factor [Bizionia]TYB78182.1 response regulator transcription factor [Bizionia saleffrena]TYC10607.1 response regulator transcription factor [Bizionia gelidisalsuginis]